MTKTPAETTGTSSQSASSPRMAVPDLIQAHRELEALVQQRTELLSRAKREWETAFDAIQSPMMIIDKDYVVIRANLALADELGRDIREAPGQRCYELRAASAAPYPRDANGPCSGCPVYRVLETGEPAEGSLQTLRGRHHDLWAFPVADHPRGAVVCHYQDTTERREMTQRLAETEKLSALGRQASSVAHQINNPLGTILALAQLAQGGDVSTEERAEWLKEIETSALRCKGVLQGLLRIADQSDMGRTTDDDQ